MEEFDVVIVGAGPSGSMAAKVLADSGCKVVLADKAVFPRAKLCGGLLTWKSIRLLEKFAGLGLDTLFELGVIHHYSSRYSIHGADRIIFSGMLSYPFYFSDRATLDYSLLEKAKEAGVCVLEECRAINCDPDTGIVICANGNVLRGKFVIGADGVNSIIRRSISAFRSLRQQWRKSLAPAMEARIPNHLFPREITDPELHVGRIQAGYGWVFPGKDHALAGICGIKQQNENFPRLFKDFIHDLGVAAPGMVVPGSHPLPYGNYFKNPCYGNYMLTGDAGGFVEPLLGEGIFFSMATGVYAAQAIAGNMDSPQRAAEEYVQSLEEYILPEFRGSDRLRWFLFRSMSLMGEPWLSFFMGMLGSRLGQTVHGMRSYSWTRMKHWDLIS